MRLDDRSVQRGTSDMDEPTRTHQQHELETQLDAASVVIRAAVLGLLRDGEVHPHVLVLAAARVMGEIGAASALAGGMPAEAVPGDLAKVVRDAGQDHAEVLRAVELPVAGSA